MVENAPISKRKSPGWWFFFSWVSITVITTDLTAMWAYASLGMIVIARVAITSLYGFLLYVTLPSLVMIGFGQWLNLRNYISRSGLWILSSIIGSVIGSTVTWFVLRIHNPTGDEWFISLVLLLAHVQYK